jgi:hypothetical protein
MAKTGKRKIANKSKKNINNKKRTKKISKKKKNRKSRKNIKKGGVSCIELFNKKLNDPYGPLSNFELRNCLEFNKNKRQKESRRQEENEKENKKQEELQKLLEEYNEKKANKDAEVLKPKESVSDEDNDYDDLYATNSDKIYHSFDRWLALWREDKYKQYFT